MQVTQTLREKSPNWLGVKYTIVMILETLLRNSLADSLDPFLIDLENESHGHNVPKDSETHFRLVIVSQTFEGLSRVKRHQLVYKAAHEVLKKGVHALAMQCFTETEWAKDPQCLISPPCKGAIKRDIR